MRRLYLPLSLACALLAPAAEKPAFRNSETLDKLVRDTAAAAVDRFGSSGLTAGKIGITVIDLADRDHPARASYRSGEPTRVSDQNSAPQGIIASAGLARPCFPSPPRKVDRRSCAA